MLTSICVFTVIVLAEYIFFIWINLNELSKIIKYGHQLYLAFGFAMSKKSFK